MLQYRLLLAFLLVSSVIACRKQDPDRSDIPVSITMEAEGGENVVNLETGGWKITGVVNQEGNQRLFGTVSSENGQKIKENTLLELDGPGSLKLSGGRYGFLIVMEASGIKVDLDENLAEEPFSFSIQLERNGETREIFVTQNASQGYTFKKIVYSLNEGDGDSLYIARGTGYEFNLISDQEVQVNPYNGVEIMRTAYFSSLERGAFSWVGTDAVNVAVPVSIRENEIFTSAAPDSYGVITKEPFTQSDQKVSIDVPAGGARYRSMLEWRKRTLSYTLTITNNRTGEDRVIGGKWIEVSPTGKYLILKE